MELINMYETGRSYRRSDLVIVELYIYIQHEAFEDVTTMCIVLDIHLVYILCLTFPYMAVPKTRMCTLFKHNSNHILVSFRSGPCNGHIDRQSIPVQIFRDVTVLVPAIFTDYFNIHSSRWCPGPCVFNGISLPHQWIRMQHIIWPDLPMVVWWVGRGKCMCEPHIHLEEHNGRWKTTY